MWSRVAVLFLMTAGVCTLSSACSPNAHSYSYDASESRDVSDVNSSRNDLDGDSVRSGDVGPDAESCQLPCEQPAVTGPQVQSAADRDAIVAIRTVTTQSTSGTGDDNGCTVSWSGWTLPTTGRATSACLAPDIDASGSSEGCGQLYECGVPYGRAFDGGFGCGNAWINLAASAKTCEVTVYSISGRQETFEVVQTGVAVGYDCRTGTGQCVHTGNIVVSPNHVTLSFAGVDGGSG